MYLVDEFVNVRLGTPYRLFKFGEIVKNGNVRNITPELAAMFKLPHFKPAIKLGSHDEPTPAGGHIVALEVRDDGLYAVPEWNEKGEAALKDGAYRYHSPEVIWGDGALENPANGEFIEGPMIVGDALLHMPHLGEDAKLYSVDPIKKGVNKMTVETVEVPKSIWDKFLATFSPQPQPEPEPEPVKVDETDEYKAVVAERDDYKAKWEAHEAEKAHRDLVEKYEGELKDTKADPDLAEILAGLPEDKASVILKQVKALSAQVDEGDVEREVGDAGEPSTDEPAAQFDAAVKAIMTEKSIGYNAALAKAKVDHKDLFEAYLKKEGK